MKTMMHRLAVLLLAGCLAAPALATVSASLDRTHVALGDTVRLLVQTDASTDQQPDISPLQQDFEVLGSSHGSSTQIVNGRMSSQTQLTLFLSPKHEGTLRIPALRWGNEQSAALELAVGGNAQAQGDTGTAAAAPVTLSATLDQKQPYVQSAVVLTLRLSVGVPLVQASLDMPGSADVLVKQLGEDTQTTESRNGRSYQVIERKYLLIPQRSGAISLKGPTLDAQVQESSVSDLNAFFGNAFGSMPLGQLMGRTRPLRLAASAISMNVQPRPAAANGRDWLPAQKVTLEESWRPDKASIHAGEPLTRHVRLTALGITGAQLPDLSKLMPLPDGIKLYPDQAKTEDQPSAGTILGSRDQDMALVASQPGRYALPAMKIFWWDTDSNTQREVSLPAQSLDVLPASASSAATPPPAVDTQASATTVEPAVAAAPKPFSVAGPTAGGNTRLWQGISAAVLLLWLLTLFAWWRARKQRSTANSANPADALTAAPQPRKPGADKALRALQEACRVNDVQAARQCLLDWAAAHWPEPAPRGLQAIAKRLNEPRYAEPLAQLDRACYTGATWQGASLAQAFSAIPKAANAKESKPLLPDLYS